MAAGGRDPRCGAPRSSQTSDAFRRYQPQTQRVQIELLRRASDGQRAQLALALSDTMLQLAWRAIREARPGATDEEVDLAFVEQCYGPELAGRLRAYLRERPR